MCMCVSVFMSAGILARCFFGPGFTATCLRRLALPASKAVLTSDHFKYPCSRIPTLTSTPYLKTSVTQCSLKKETFFCKQFHHHSS